MESQQSSDKRTQLNVACPVGLARMAKAQAAERGESLQDFVVVAIERRCASLKRQQLAKPRRTA